MMAKTMVRICCKTSSWTTVKRSAPTPSAEKRVARRQRHKRREKINRMTDKVATTQAMAMIIVRSYGWSNELCLADQPNAWLIYSVWARPTRVSCRAWIVVLTHSTGPARHYYIFLL
jgi:hypothetical protein